MNQRERLYEMIRDWMKSHGYDADTIQSLRVTLTNDMASYVIFFAESQVNLDLIEFGRIEEGDLSIEDVLSRETSSIHPAHFERVVMLRAINDNLNLPEDLFRTLQESVEKALKYPSDEVYPITAGVAEIHCREIVKWLRDKLKLRERQEEAQEECPTT